MRVIRWREATLGEVCDEVDGLIQTGPFGSQLHQSDYSDEGIPVVMPKDIVEGRISPDTVARVSTEHVKRLSRHKLATGDIVYGRRGDIGRQALIRSGQAGWLCGTGCLRLSLGDSVIDSLFLHYYLQQNEVVEWIANQAVGATMPNLNTAILRSVPVRFPPLLVQRCIASILSAYDELIENSQRRIKILEAMARALYREWFVDFRFPGHDHPAGQPDGTAAGRPAGASARDGANQHVPLVPSSLGEIPQGWEVETVEDTFEISGGGTPSRKKEEYWEGGTIQWYSPSDLTRAGSMFMDDSSDHITELGLGKSSARLFPARSVMLTSRATIGAIAINTQPACTNQGFITCIPNERVPLYFLFHWVAENVPNFQRLASGATFKEISRSVFKTIHFLQPPMEVTEGFEAIAGPMAEQVLTLQRQIQTLRRTRDLLLPRLLSGRIDVTQFPETETA